MVLYIKLAWTFVIGCFVSVFSIMLFDDYLPEVIKTILKGLGIAFGVATFITGLIGLWAI